MDHMVNECFHNDILGTFTDAYILHKEITNVQYKEKRRSKMGFSKTKGKYRTNKKADISGGQPPLFFSTDKIIFSMNYQR